MYHVARMLEFPVLLEAHAVHVIINVRPIFIWYTKVNAQLKDR